MIFYHGTIKAYADSIIREGLKPSPSLSFHVSNIAPPRGIYLTRNKVIASWFANWRRNYTKAEPGEFIDFEMWKNEEGQPAINGIDTTPVVISFDIPLSSFPLTYDPDSSGPHEGNLVCDCEIPAKYITGMEVMELPKL